MAAEPKLQVRTQIPPFQLMSADGQAVNIWDFKALKHMVLVFLPRSDCPSCIEFLRTAVNTYNQYEEERAVWLPVVRGNVEQAVAIRDAVQPPFPVLFDPEGKVTGQYTNVLPAVFVADKFGELYAEWFVGTTGIFPSQKDILDVVELINLECPECGARLDWE